ncbi:MAG TPA: ABC transporter permease [Terriglobales bacterium]|jgi:putative ABC transport system permease protein
MFLKELISQSWQALMRNRLRSVLTMLGIVWGLASVVILLAYGQGLGGSVLHAFMNMGNNVVVLWPGQTSMQAGGQRAGKPVNYEYEDVEAIREEVPIVRAVSAEIVQNFGFKYGTRVVSIGVRGVELPYGQMRKLDIEDGRYFTEDDFIDHRRVVILGYDAAKKVFQGAPAIGQFVNIGGLEFEVIGVMKNKIQDSMYMGPDNENGFIPFGLFRDLKNQRDPNMIIFQPLSAALNTKATAAVREVIARRHHFDPKDEKATPVWDTIESGQMIGAFSLGLQAVLGLIGAVTLGVGGVGVMNIMLVSVTERTREIGLRKALGARRSHVLVQFLLEALVLTFSGGLIGMAFAVLLTWVIPPMPLYSDLYKTANHEGDIFLHASSTVMLASFIILSMVGIVSGFFPALKASRMDPVDALRYD